MMRARHFLTKMITQLLRGLWRIQHSLETFLTYVNLLAAIRAIKKRGFLGTSSIENHVESILSSR